MTDILKCEEYLTFVTSFYGNISSSNRSVSDYGGEYPKDNTPHDNTLGGCRSSFNSPSHYLPSSSLFLLILCLHRPKVYHILDVLSEEFHMYSIEKKNHDKI